MIQKTKHAHTNYEMITPFVEETDKCEGAIRCQSSGYMDLCIEKLWYRDCYNNPVYSIAHYGRQNGDAMRDPDITFSVNRETKTIIPQTFQNDYMGVYQEVFKEIGGKMMYSKSLLSSLDDFLWFWLKNIKDQGFKPEIHNVIL